MVLCLKPPEAVLMVTLLVTLHASLFAGRANLLDSTAVYDDE